MYPVAILYPLNLTSEDLKSDDIALPRIERMKSILQEMPGYELTRAFIEALECMQSADLKFKDGLGEMRTVNSRPGLTDKQKSAVKCYFFCVCVESCVAVTPYILSALTKI